MLKSCIFAILITLCVSGCSRIDKGTITGKVYHKAWVQNSMILIGKILVPQTIYHGEKWELTIYEAGEEGWCYVDEETYNAKNIGDYIVCE